LTPPEEDPRRTSLGSLLVYVLGFMGILAVLAFLAVWLLRR
jgi:hypothetical protein